VYAGRVNIMVIRWVAWVFMVSPFPLLWWGGHRSGVGHV
jgi:hypothetical protein